MNFCVIWKQFWQFLSDFLRFYPKWVTNPNYCEFLSNEKLASIYKVSRKGKPRKIIIFENKNYVKSENIKLKK